MSPEVLQPGEEASLASGAEDPEDVLCAGQVDQQAEAVIWLLGDIYFHNI